METDRTSRQDKTVKEDELLLSWATDFEEDEEEQDARFKPTLCWRCQNAVPDGTHGCPWSEKEKPVPGWNAEQNNLLQQYYWRGKTASHYVTSYRVIDCPLFVPDLPRKDHSTELYSIENISPVTKRRTLRHNRRKAGLCSCGREREDKNYKTCEFCRKRSREWNRKRDYDETYKSVYKEAGGKKRNAEKN